MGHELWCSGGAEHLGCGDASLSEELVQIQQHKEGFLELIKRLDSENDLIAPARNPNRMGPNLVDRLIISDLNEEDARSLSVVGLQAAEERIDQTLDFGDREGGVIGATLELVQDQPRHMAL
jgi:hypothetical protein